MDTVLIYAVGFYEFFLAPATKLWNRLPAKVPEVPFITEVMMTSSPRVRWGFIAAFVTVLADHFQLVNVPVL